MYEKALTALKQLAAREEKLQEIVVAVEEEDGKAEAVYNQVKK